MFTIIKSLLSAMQRYAKLFKIQNNLFFFSFICGCGSCFTSFGARLLGYDESLDDSHVVDGAVVLVGVHPFYGLDHFHAVGHLAKHGV